jgi:uncharacterized protein YeeX (DUF496 family)
MEKEKQEGLLLLGFLLLIGAGAALVWIIEQLIWFFSEYGQLIAKVVVTGIAGVLIILATLFLVKQYQVYHQRQAYRKTIFFKIDQDEKVIEEELHWVAEILPEIELRINDIKRQLSVIHHPSPKVMRAVEQRLFRLMEQRGKLHSAREDFLDNKLKLQDHRQEIKLLKNLNEDRLADFIDEELMLIEQSIKDIAVQMKFEYENYKSDLLIDVDTLDLSTSPEKLLVKEKQC